MQRRHHLRAIARCGGHPLDRSGADVADRENAAPAGFERQPPLGGIGPGLDEAVMVER